MADFIQNAAAQEAEPSRSEFLSPAQQAQAGDAAGQSAAPPIPQPQGMPQGAGMGATQEDPFNAPEEAASEDEQAQYDDLFNRAMAMVNDTRQNGDGPSVADAVIKLMSVKNKEAHVAIGQTAGMVMTYMIDMAKRQKVEYSGPVIQEVGMDLVLELAKIAGFSGAIENMPEEDSPEFEKLMELSALEAAKMFGEWQLQTGQADREGHMKEVQGQMQREADSGQLDDWEMEELDPKMRERVLGAMQNNQGAG